MRRGALIALILLCMCACAAFQQGSGLPAIGSTWKGSSGLVVTGGWTWLQGTSATVSVNSGPFWLQNQCVLPTNSFCTMALAPTTAGSDLVFGLITVATDTQTISSAFTCASLIGGKCTVGNAIDTCTTGAFAHTSTNDHSDACYVANSAGGANFVTENWSGTPANNNTFIEMEEILPPLCNGVRCTSSFDSNLYNFSNSSCAATCTGSAMTLTATDGIIGIYDSSGGPPDNFVAPYQNDYVGNMFALDATSAPAYQVKFPNWYTLNQFAFKSQGLSYSPTAPLFSWANANTQDPSIILPGRATTVPCNPTCSLTLVTTTATGHLGVLLALNNGAAGVISSVTGAGTWTVPTGASTCQQAGLTTKALSCAYNLSMTSGVTSLSVTASANGNYQFAYFDDSRTGGSNLLDGQNSVFNAGGSATVSAPSVTVTGPDACFVSFAFTQSAGVEVNQSYYPQPRDANQWLEIGTIGSVGMLLNVPNGAPLPVLYMQGTTTASAASIICFK